LAEVLLEVTDGQTTVYLLGLGRLAQVEDGEWEWFLGDALGSVRQVVDGDGAVVLARDYTPFGLVSSESGTGNSGYAFTGEQWDSDRALLFLRARHYRPVVGRFLDLDPWDGSIQHPQTQHKYVYVANDPIGHSDPSGHRLEPGPGGGRIDPVTGETVDWLPLIQLVPSTGGMFAQSVDSAASIYQVPPQMVALILATEIGFPDWPLKWYSPLFGAETKFEEQRLKHKQGWGRASLCTYCGDLGRGPSLGVGNIKPGTAAIMRSHFLQHYPETEMACTVYWQDTDDKKWTDETIVHMLSQDHINIQFVAANLRRAKDTIYGVGYTGPIGEVGLALLGAFHTNDMLIPQTADRFAGRFAEALSMGEVRKVSPTTDDLVGSYKGYIEQVFTNRAIPYY